MSNEEGVKLVIKALLDVVESGNKNIELMVITENETRFLTEEELEKLIESTKEWLEKLIRWYLFETLCMFKMKICWQYCDKNQFSAFFSCYSWSSKYQKSWVSFSILFLFLSRRIFAWLVLSSAQFDLGLQ